MARRPTFNTAFGSLPTPRDQMGFSTSTGRAPGIDTYDAVMERNKAKQREQSQQQYNAYMGQTGQRAGGPPPIAGWTPGGQMRGAPATGAAPAGAAAAPSGGAPSGGTPSGAPATRAQTPQGPQPTFAEMQAQGRARPAPPPAAGAMDAAAAELRSVGRLEDQLAEQLQMRDRMTMGPAPTATPGMEDASLQRRLAGQLGMEQDAMADEFAQGIAMADAQEQGIAPSTDAMEVSGPDTDPALLEQLRGLLGEDLGAMPAPSMAEGAAAPEGEAMAGEAMAEGEAPESAMVDGEAAAAVMPDGEAMAGEAMAGELGEEIEEEPLEEAAAVAPAAAPVPAPTPTMAPTTAPTAPTAAPSVAQQVAAQLGVEAPEEMPLQAPQAPQAPMASPMTAPSLTQQLSQQLGMAGTEGMNVPQSGATSALQDRLLRQLSMLEDAPSRFDDPGFTAARDAARANLEAQFGAERQRIDEEMARRGLSASSIASGRMGDLAGQQARALATMEADFLKEAAMTQAQDRALLLQNYQQLLGTMSENERSEFDRALKRYEIDGTLSMRAKELQQEASLRGRSMNIEEANNLARIDLAREEMAQKDRQFGADLQFRQQELDARQSNFQSELNARESEFVRNLSQQDKDRAARLKISDNEIAVKYAELKQNNDQFLRAQTEKERANIVLEKIEEDRAKLGKDELAERKRQYDTTRTDEQAIQTWKQGVTAEQEKRAARELGLRENATQVEILDKMLPYLADLSPEEAVAFMKDLGINVSVSWINKIKGSGPSQPGPGQPGSTRPQDRQDTDPPTI